MHVSLGLPILALLWRELRSAKQPRLQFAETSATYWHMVDSLWIAIFALLYLMREMMSAYLRSPPTLVWSLLTAVTFASWWLGAGREGVPFVASLSVTIGVVAIALIKTRRVFWYFMEVRTAPAWLRWNRDGWLAFLAVMLVALYGFSR